MVTRRDHGISSAVTLGISEWKYARNWTEEYDTHCKYVSLPPVISVLIYYFRRHIRLGTTIIFQLMYILIYSETKITKLYIEIWIYEDILHFKISMSYFSFIMQVLYSIYYLPHEETTTIFTLTTLLNQVQEIARHIL